MENLFYTSKKLLLVGTLLLFFSCANEPLNDDSLKTSSQSLTAKISPDKDYLFNVFKGTEIEIGNGIVRSWIRVKRETGKSYETGIPDEIGIEMTPGALEGLPEHGHGPTIVVPLHPKAKQLTPFDHIGLNWNPEGHNPQGVFSVPHFDIHFYMISNEERLAIPDYSPETHAAFNTFPQPVSEYMPLGYISPNGPGEGQMGKHWLPLYAISDPLFFFEKIMIYGTYDGEFIFLEPMVTRAYLLSNPNFSDPYTQPAKFEKEGYYPTMYNISRDSETGITNITLSGFVHRDAPTPPPSL